MNPLRMYGTTVQLHRYQITYDTDRGEVTEYAVTEEEANAIASRTGGSVSPMETSGNEWIDGLEFETRDEAIRLLEAGEEAYKAAVQKREAMSNERLREDVDRAMEAEGLWAVRGLGGGRLHRGRYAQRQGTDLGVLPGPRHGLQSGHHPGGRRLVHLLAAPPR